MTPAQIAEARALVDAAKDDAAWMPSCSAADTLVVCTNTITALLDALKAHTKRADAAELREAALLATNETERQTLIRHNAAHAAQVADLKATMDGLLDAFDNHISIPDANCTCHLAPPCGDCVNWSFTRDIIEAARAAIKSGGA